VLLTENTLLHARLLDAHRRGQRDNQLLQQKTSELLAANEDLDSFSYSVSHDLRAPLRAVDGFTQMLEQDYGAQLDQEGRRLLAVVRTSTHHMARLIEDLLSFARLGRQPMRTVSVALTPLVRAVVAELRPEQGERSIEFEVGNLGHVQGDPALLKHVFVNLLSNAVKFSRDRHPAVIEVGGDATTESGGLRHYYVKDNGAGFDMRHYDKMFGVFQRLHTTAEFPGTGVGLAIVSRIVERHGGRVWAEGVADQGATFHLTLKAELTPATDTITTR
jgi:light-regulated signal transduction histidine kinase (bacteriophytochrome)